MGHLRCVTLVGGMAGSSREPASTPFVNQKNKKGDGSHSEQPAESTFTSGTLTYLNGRKRFLGPEYLLLATPRLALSLPLKPLGSVPAFTLIKCTGCVCASPYPNYLLLLVSLLTMNSKEFRRGKVKGK